MLHQPGWGRVGSLPLTAVVPSTGMLEVICVITVPWQPPRNLKFYPFQNRKKFKAPHLVLTHSHWYELIGCVTPKLICWKPNPQCDCIWSLWAMIGHESGALVNGISALTKRSPGSLSAPSAMWRHSAKVPSLNQSGPLPDTEPDVLLIFNFSASRTAQNRLLLFINLDYGIFVVTTQRN